MDETTATFYQALRKNGFFNNGIFIIVGDHRRFEPLGNLEIENGGYVVWGEKIVGGIISKWTLPNSMNNMPFTLRDMNTLMHFFIDGKTTVTDDLLLQANLSTQLGLDSPMAVTLTIQDDTGTYLIRTDKYSSMMISIFGNVPFNEIPNLFYKEATAYLIMNNELIVKKLAS